MKKIGKVAAAIVGGAISILGVIMAAAWLALAFVAPIVGLKFCILYYICCKRMGGRSKRAWEGNII